MPPKRAKKNASNDANAAPAIAPSNSDVKAHTPEHSLKKKETGITEAQRQQLIDNVQEEGELPHCS
jgi:hypothetical protein